jgi:hypothetical protein
MTSKQRFGTIRHMYRIWLKWRLMRIFSSYLMKNKKLDMKAVAERQVNGVDKYEFCEYLMWEKHFRKPLYIRFPILHKIRNYCLGDKQQLGGKKSLKYSYELWNLWDDCKLKNYLSIKNTGYQVSPNVGENFITISGLVETVATEKKVFIGIILALFGLAFFQDVLGLLGRLFLERISGVKL